MTLATGAPQFGRALFHDLAGRDKQIADTSGKAASADGKGEASREERWKFCTNWSLPPEDTLEFVSAEVHGGSNDPRVSPKNPYRGRLGQQIVVPPGPGGRHPVTGEIVKPGDHIWIPYRQHSLYFGILTVVFAIVGIVGWWRRADAQERVPPTPSTEHQALGTKHQALGTSYSDVPFWSISALIVYLCALGCFTPFYRLVFALPFGDYLRAPVKFVHLLEFCTAVLAGYGFAWAQERFGATRAWVGALLCVLAAVNVIDLARVDAKYLAVEDVSFQKAANDAAEDIAKLGGGKVFVGMPMMSQRDAMSSPARAREAERQRNELRRVRESLGAHLAETADLPVDDKGKLNVRFVLASHGIAEHIKQSQRGKVTSVGGYSLSFRHGDGQGILRTSQGGPMLELLQVMDIPAPTASTPSPDRTAQLLTLLSVLLTAGALVWAGAAAFAEMRRRSAC